MRKYDDKIMEYLKTHPSPLERNQKTMLKSLNMGQATFNYHIGILIGQGKVSFEKFATTKIYFLLPHFMDIANQLPPGYIPGFIHTRR